MSSINKTTLLLVGVFIASGIFAVSATTGRASQEDAHGITHHWTAVRAQYIDLDGNRDEVNTICILVNTSRSSALRLGEITALGPGGLEDVLGTHTDLDGTLIPPLGTVELAVSSETFPGLLPELQDDQRLLQNVLVKWRGPGNALRLSTRIERQRPGNLENRVHLIEEGFRVTR